MERGEIFFSFSGIGDGISVYMQSAKAEITICGIQRENLVIKWNMVCFHCLLKDFHAVKISILMALN